MHVVPDSDREPSYHLTPLDSRLRGNDMKSDYALS